MPRVFRTIASMREWRRQEPRVGFVATMGALHAGHGSLIEESVRESPKTVVSIYVNPTQFGPGEDLDKYPRTFEKDLELVRKIGADAVFLPSTDELYSEGYSTFVSEEIVSSPYCGQFRSGHFRGVATIVLKLLNIIQPYVSFWGLKDAQQFLVIRKMIQDLNLAHAVRGLPTVREADGLAMSSRNGYLSDQERERAPLLYRCLKRAKEEIMLGQSPDKVIRKVTATLQEAGFETQYLELRSVPQLELVAEYRGGQELLLAYAGYLGKTRLIDNVFLGQKELDL